MLYVSGRRLGMAYSPAEPVTLLRVWPVFTDVMVTVAPGTTAPVLSVIVPLTVPLSACPNRPTETSRSTHNRTLTLLAKCCIVFSPLTTIRRLPQTQTWSLPPLPKLRHAHDQEL